MAVPTFDPPVARGHEELVLVSHVLCPYVQRCVICARELGVVYQRVDVNLGDRPQWFSSLSPLGKVPLLLVPGSDEPLFESDVICQYLDETGPRRLLPDSPLARGRHRSWMAFASAMLNDIGRLYSARTEDGLREAAAGIRTRLGWLEATFNKSPWFSGATFGVVDAAFAPAFRYFDVFDGVLPENVFRDVPRLAAWRERLAKRPPVVAAVSPDYPQRLLEFVADKRSVLGERIRLVETLDVE